MVSVKVYVEGGGDRGDLRTRCRQGFTAFFRNTDLKNQMPRVIACGSREEAFGKFRSALSAASDDDFVLLLVDSEGPVAEGAGPWLHLKTRDNWNKPAGATDENAHLMVQCMEAWFLADRAALASYFGNDFNEDPLPRQVEVERASKQDIERGLNMATRQCKRGRYHKGRHSFAILAELNPDKVTNASPHAERLINTLLDRSTISQ